MVYVMSDIHGNQERFNSIMKQIRLQDDDTLYILGDVVDRYPDGIKILRKIMKMPNAQMLLGNHEHMMMKAIGHCEDAVSERVNTNWQYRRIWYGNGGKVTHEQLKHIRKEQRAEVFRYIRSLPLNIDVEVNGVRYKLVHASPLENYGTDKWQFVDYEDESEFAVWERWDTTQNVPAGCILIFGHTRTSYFQKGRPLTIWRNDEAIGIDCGSGYDEGRLACLRLDDMRVFYSE